MKHLSFLFLFWGIGNFFGILLAQDTQQQKIDSAIALINSYYNARPKIHYTMNISDGSVNFTNTIYAVIGTDGHVQSYYGAITCNYPIAHAVTIRTVSADNFIAILPRTNKLVYFFTEEQMSSLVTSVGSRSIGTLKELSKNISYKELNTTQFELTFYLDMGKLEEKELVPPFSQDMTVVVKAESLTGKITESRMIIVGSPTKISTFTYHTTSAVDIDTFLNSLPSIDTSLIDRDLSFQDAYNNELTTLYQESK